MNQKEQFLKFIESVKPEIDFDPLKCPVPPNYQNESDWAALPKKDGFHNLSPDTKPSIETKKYDVFYIHPTCLLYTSPSPRDLSTSRMPSSA